MSQRPFDRLQDLFHGAANLEGEQRTSFLDKECADDARLRREVEDLLARDGISHSLVRVGLADQVDEAMAERYRIPRCIGPYEILGLVGRGGMGVVYRARQQNPERIVALKVMRPAVFSAKLLERFELEKQVLARLQHPSIARIFGAGTTDIGLGTQPWFAMELVEGQDLSRWAEGKSARQKLELVVQLCEAVHHAHQNGVIHRDLKPDNIQVDADGRPKVLDFGVARVTDSDLKLTTIRTDVRSLVGTLPYMSPEQAQGETDRLGLASDVYALGVVTYELLCGELPYDLRGKPVAEAARVIADEDPRPLSSMDRVFRGDLETIVGKALAKEPGERYATAADLAADVLRFLRDEPIRARPPSTWYQLRKLAQRNRKLFLMTAGAFVALLGGTITSTVLALREAKARGAAVAQAKRAEEIADFALSVFAPRDPEQAERDVTAVLDHAVERVEDQLADHPDFAADLYYVIGNFYLTLARFVDAERTLTRAVAEHRRLADRHPEKLVSSLNLLRGCYESRRDAVGSARVWAELAELYDRTLGAEAPETVEARLFHASCLGKAGDFERANELLQGLMPLVERSTSGRDTMNVGASLYRGGEFRKAEGFLLRVVELEPGSTLEVEDEVHFWALFQLAALAADTGRLEEAERYSARMVEAMESQDETGERPGTAYSLYMRGHVLHGLGRDVECEQLARRAIRIVDAAGHTMGFPWRELGVALLGQGRLQEAEEALREYRDRQAGNGGDGEWYVGQAEALLGRTLRAQGRRSEAEALGRTAVERQRRVLPPKHPRIADALEPLAETLVELGRHDEAEAACLEALGIRRACMDEHAAPIASLRLIQAEILCARGEATAAFALAEEACLDFQAAYRPDHPEMARAHRVLAHCAPPELARETREALWRTAYELRENALGPEHPDTRVSRHELEGFLSAHGE